MMRLAPAVCRFGLPLLCALVCLRTQGDAAGFASSPHMAFPAVMPQTVVWAWEEPEDLRSAPVATAGVAFLAETLFLGAERNDFAAGTPAVRMVSRHQPLAVAAGAPIMAVVRLIALKNFRDTAELRAQTTAALAGVARRPGLRALQIDFDATRSQRSFYAAVLRRLRPQMPGGMPLSITALVSWCAAVPGSADDWISTLPIDEAVPMFFRMGGSPGGAKSGYPLREPLCRGSEGIATDESWPQIRTGERIYVFAPRPWTTAQLAALEEISRGQRDAALSSPGGVRAVNDTGLANLRAGARRDTSEEDLP